MKLLIVIVNYRTGPLVVDCLRSLPAELETIPGVSVVVTDNASGDASIELIEGAIRYERWSDWASTMPLARNGGFAFGNNRAIEAAITSADPPRYVMLLNPDTLVLPGAVAELLNFMDAHPRVGVAGSRLELRNGKPECSAFRFPSIPGEIDNGLRLGVVSRLLARYVVAPGVSDRAHRCDWVSGASLIVRREVFENVGLLDERFFLYFEETDFCRRAARQGWQCWHVPASRVVHFVGQASGLTDASQPQRRRPSYWFESRKRYFRRNHGVVYAALADVAFAVGYALWRVRRVVQRKPDLDPPHLLGDFVRYSLSRVGWSERSRPSDASAHA